MNKTLIILLYTSNVALAQDKSLNFNDLLKTISGETHVFSMQGEGTGVKLGSSAVNYSTSSKPYTKGEQR